MTRSRPSGRSLTNPLLKKQDLLLYHKKLLQEVYSQSHQIKVTENRNIASVNYTTSLFKSNQEVELFMSIREVFQMYVVYPNVGLSCVVNFDKLKNSLSQEEKSFFFRGIIDCVVFDQHNDYKPIKFFELDSSYHDSLEQQYKLSII